MRRALTALSIITRHVLVVVTQGRHSLLAAVLLSWEVVHVMAVEIERYLREAQVLEFTTLSCHAVKLKQVASRSRSDSPLRLRVGWKASEIARWMSDPEEVQAT